MNTVDEPGTALQNVAQRSGALSDAWEPEGPTAPSSASGFEDDLGALIPDYEQDDDDAIREELDHILGEGRDFLGLPPDAPIEAIQRGFGADLWKFWIFFFVEFRQDEHGQEIPGAPFHLELADTIQQLVTAGRPGQEEARAYPREHGKSVFASLVGPLWALLNLHRRFYIQFSVTSTLAEEFLDDIRNEIEMNDRMQAIYPEACEWERKPRANRLMFGNGALAMAAGAGKAIRGARKGKQRPDYITLDDIENDQEVENPNRRRTKMRWYNRVVKKLGRAAVILIVGTILHASSFLAERVKADEHITAALVTEPARMDMWNEWEHVFNDRELKDAEAEARAFYATRKSEMDRGAEVLWPGNFSLYGLMVERAEDLASFLSERQNNPFDPAASWFPEDRITWVGADDLPSESEILVSIGFWDPSRGTSKSDTSALPRLDCYEDGRRVVRWTLCDRIPPEEVMEIALGEHKRRAFTVLGVEKVGLSSYDEQLQAAARAIGLALPVEPVTPVGSKHGRIRSLRPLIVGGVLQFHEALPLEAKRQLNFYPSHPNDDFPDAVQQASKLADEYLTEVEAAGAVAEASPEDYELDGETAFGHEPLAARPMRSRLEDRLRSYV